ncbi:hypothetical protein F0562_026850 [Nyssa sinensis]|uniref:Mechanosensitive ion channel MscS domain-containing protein n=1 Tax=Nyssa sinensis TaxID=561372 RepID=A0A5J5B2J8_9ASTE|nr:hypothetical protein F0562_026850 [Nyssa sinensis]
MAQYVDHADRREVHVKISGRDSPRETELASQSQATGGAESVNNIWRESSYDFSKDATKVSKELDFVTDSPLSQCSQGLSRIAESPTYGQLSPEDIRVSFNEATTEQVRRRSNASGGYGGSEDEVVLCSSNSSFHRRSILLKTKTKSRLMDPPEQDQRSQRMLKFGMSGNGSEIVEDDPLLDEDLPEEYKKMKFSTLTLLQLQEHEEEERVLAEVQKLQNAGATLPADLRATDFPRRGNLIGSGRHQKTPKAAKSPRFSRTMSMKKNEGITIDHLHRLNQKNISAWNMKRYIYLEDLIRFMKDDEALKTMHLFEGTSGSKGISKRVLKNRVVNVFRERRALALSLNDTKTAVNKLHQMLNVLMGVIIVVIWLLILKVATTHFFIFLSSQLLLVVFMFGNTCKTTFEAIIFLFVMHPFDVGDRCEVDEVQMVVEEMNILTTVFLRYDNQKIMYPNSVLATKPISNYYRSPDMGDAIDFCIHISTPMERIATMKERITRYIENKSDHWYPAPMIVMRDVEDMNKLKWSVWLSHRMNHQDMGERWERRALLVEEMVKVLKELDIEYRMLPLDMNVRNMPALNSNRLPSNWTACAN